MDPITILTALGPVGAACISALVGIGTAIYNVYKARQVAESTPEMRINQQAKTDNTIFAEAEQAISESDAGKPGKEQTGDAQ